MKLEQGVSLRKQSKNVQAVWGSRAGGFNCDVSTTLESQAASEANRSVHPHLRTQRRGHTAQRRTPEQPAHRIRRRQQFRHIDAGLNPMPASMWTTSSVATLPVAPGA
jgi:hypothetical protein